MTTAQRRVTQIDTETGEIYQALVAVQLKKRNAFNNWAAWNMDAFERIAKMRLPATTQSVLFMLGARLDYENLIKINQAEIARQLGMHRQHVNRAIKQLLTANIIEQGPKLEGTATYRLSPEIGWKGSAKSHHEAMRDRMKAAGIRRVIRNDHTTT